MHTDKRHIVEINKQQAEFYDKFHTNEELNLPSRLWRQFRRHIRSTANVTEQAYEFQQAAFMTAKPRRVLEVGCYEGRDQSMWLIRAPWLERYVGIELSETAIRRFRARLAPEDAAKTELIAGDFIVHELPEASFDAVYMHGVFHHFPDPDPVVERVAQLLVPGGSFITFDPMETNPLFRAVRAVYRPFQSDRDWEWPLREAAFGSLKERLELQKLQGFLGREMYGAVLYTLCPLPPVARFWQHTRQIDVERAATIGPGLFRCNSVVMWWQKPV